MMRLRHLFISTAVVSAGVAVGGTAWAAPTKVGTETFTSTFDINSNGGGPVTATGVINATGTDIVISPTEDLFDFGAAGQITVFHSPLHSVDHFSQKKCSFSFTEKGTYVFGNGTGEFAAYSGSGRYTSAGSATNACDDTPVGTVTINASGPISPVSSD
jgi:hypothetical protein